MLYQNPSLNLLFLYCFEDQNFPEITLKDVPKNFFFKFNSNFDFPSAFRKHLKYLNMKRFSMPLRIRTCD